MSGDIGSVYIDDIVVYSGTVDKHVGHLRQICMRLHRYSLNLYTCLRDLLMSPPVLAYPHCGKGFVIYTDASIESW